MGTPQSQFLSPPRTRSKLRPGELDELSTAPILKSASQETIDTLFACLIEFGMDLITWIASVLCAIGIAVTAISALKHKDSHFFIQNDFFLPLYAAGILQWVLYGCMIEDWALILPSGVQLLCLTPVLRHWVLLRRAQ